MSNNCQYFFIFSAIRSIYQKIKSGEGFDLVCVHVNGFMGLETQQTRTLTLVSLSAPAKTSVAEPRGWLH